MWECGGCDWGVGLGSGGGGGEGLRGKIVDGR